MDFISPVLRIGLSVSGIYINTFYYDQISLPFFLFVFFSGVFLRLFFLLFMVLFFFRNKSYLMWLIYDAELNLLHFVTEINNIHSDYHLFLLKSGKTCVFFFCFFFCFFFLEKNNLFPINLTNRIDYPIYFFTLAAHAVSKTGR